MNQNYRKYDKIFHFCRKYINKLKHITIVVYKEKVIKFYGEKQGRRKTN
jgi:hypothetical protein